MQLRHTLLSIPSEPDWLDASLAHAPDARGLVLLPELERRDANPRGAAISATLESTGYATLRVDILTSHEHKRDPDAPYNIPLLAQRLANIHTWIAHQHPLAGLPCALLTEATLCAAAIRAAWKQPESFAALVCAGGRPDLAGGTPLNQLRVPLCMIVAADDPHRTTIRQAFERLGGPRQWLDLPSDGADTAEATVLLATLACDWLQQQLPPPVADSEAARSQP